MKPKIRKYKPEEILAIFKEQHRLVSPLDSEAEEWMDISRDMTIRDWRAARDLIGWKKLYKYLNQEFRTDIDEKTWKMVLEPASKKTLTGVCELLAKSAHKEIIEPIKIFGTNCLSAAIFLSLKRKMATKGVDITNLRPSSSLSPYLEKYFSPVLEEIILTGYNPIKKIEEKRKKKGFWNTLNIFDPDRYELRTGDIVTFRDLVEGMMEKRRNIV